MASADPFAAPGGANLRDAQGCCGKRPPLLQGLHGGLGAHALWAMRLSLDLEGLKQRIHAPAFRVSLV